jgi:hypothetical protein
VQRKVLHYVVDGFQYRHIVALYDNVFAETFGRNAFNCAGGFADCLVQPSAKFRDAYVPSCGEFCISLPLIGLAVNGRYDPLSDVSAQVQHKIRDRIGFLRSAPPNLIRRQAFQAVLNPALELAQLLDRKAEEKAFHNHPEYKIEK